VSSRFEQTREELAYEGRIAKVFNRWFRHEDGEEVEREIVGHTGAVGIVAHDGERIWLVRQPREAVGVPDLLELPAGKLDKDGEPPLETAKRELAEEIGKAAGTWEHLKTYYSSAGYTDEAVHVYLATDLRDVEQPDSGEEERIEICSYPLSELDALIEEATDAKTLIGLCLLRARR
jgi:ADP-ribose pyrophosphatase